MRIWRGPNVWCLDSLLSVLQIDLSACADRKIVIFYVYLRYFLKKSQFYRTDTQIKIIETVCEGFIFAHHPMCICVYLRICIFSKVITALGLIYWNPKSNIYLLKANLDANALLTLSIYTRQTQQSAQLLRPCVSGEFDI